MFVLPLCTLAVTPPDTTPETVPDAKLSNHPTACSGDQGKINVHGNLSKL